MRWGVGESLSCCRTGQARKIYTDKLCTEVQSISWRNFFLRGRRCKGKLAESKAKKYLFSHLYVRILILTALKSPSLKQYIYLLLLLSFSFSAFGQKMKFKKRQILFDKEVAYNFDKTAGKGLAGLRAFAMVSAAGDTILTFKPIELHFDALPFEEEAKYFNAYHQIKLHETGESFAIEYSPIGLPNQTFQYMRNTKILTFDGMDYDKLDAFVAAMGSAQKIIDDHRQENRNRLARYKSTVDVYGEASYVKRPDASVVIFGDKIQISKTNIGKWAQTGKNRDYVIYMIKNMKGNNIAQLHMKLLENKIIVMPVVDDERHELTFIPTVIATKTTDLIKKAAGKLVDLGYL
jgi:hypothetical protein